MIKNTPIQNFKKLCSGRACNASFLLLLVLSVIPFMARSQFVGASIPNTYFPKPIGPSYPISTTPRLPRTPYFPGLNYSFYNQRNNGSCYSATYDFDPLTPGLENIYVWSIAHTDVLGYNSAVAFEVMDAGGALLCRSVHYLGGDVANLQVGLNQGNSGLTPDLIVAYWETSEIKLARFSMGITTGLTHQSTGTVATLSGAAGRAQHIGLDCHDLDKFVVVWEDQGFSCGMRAYDYSGGGVGAGPVIPFGSAGGRLPDVALSHNTPFGSGAIDVHIAYVETAAQPVIHKLHCDFGALVLGLPTIVIEDAHTTSGPFFGEYFDEFTLKIDAPDHYGGAVQSNWAYTYFNNDNNKIKVRLCNRSAGTVFSTYTVNDGSLLTNAATTLANLTRAGNAFPTITYAPDAQSVYVAWFTNYDPAWPWPAANNALYDYTANSQGYISVVLSELGVLNTTDYHRVDFDYSTNRINWGPSYPKICFSKNNDAAKMFSIFNSHDYKADLLWSVAGLGSVFLGKYYERPGVGLGFMPTSLPTYDAGHYYDGGVITGSGTSTFICQKAADWYPATPLFKSTAAELMALPVKEQLQPEVQPFYGPYGIPAARQRGSGT